MFQAKLQGWKRLAASVLMLPGLTAVGAEMLHLIGPASAAERSAATDPAKAETAKAMMRQAQTAYSKGDYARARELAEAVKTMNVSMPVGEDTPEELLADIQKKTGGRMASKSRTTTEDPRILVKRAKDALDAGRLDAAQDLARQADANSQNVSWGLFEDTPSSVMKSIQKVRGKRDRAEAEQLLNKARALYEKRVGTEEVRAANLDKARTYCMQAAQLHGEYSMWDFGDRPQSLVKDIDTARSKLKVPVRRNDRENDVVKQPKSFDPHGDRDPEMKSNGYNRVKPDKNQPLGPLVKKGPNSNKPILPDDPEDPVMPKADTPPVKPEITLFDIPEPPLPVKPMITKFGDPETPANASKMQAVALMKDAQNLQRDKKYVEAHHKLVEARGLKVTFSNDEPSPEMAMQSLIGGAQAQIKDLCRLAHENMVKKTAAEVAKAEQQLTEAEAIAAALGLDRMPVSELRWTLKVIKGNTAVTVGAEIPRIEEIPPAIVIPPDPNSPVQVDAKVPKADAGLQLLAQAREEIRAAQFDNARKIVAQVLNGPYACKNEAQDLLRTIDAEDMLLRKDAARVSFDRATAAYQNKNYEQALAMFKLIDSSLLPLAKQKMMREMSIDAAAGGLVQSKVPGGPADQPSVDRNGADSLLKQQEALNELQFQKLRSRGLQIEASATARFGKGDTDVALNELQAFVVEVNSSSIDPSKKAMLTRPIESRVERLKVLKHQQDFLVKEAKDLKNFRNQMTQEALHQAHKKEEVKRMMTDFNRLLEEGKYKEANMLAMQARELDPEDPATQAAMTMSRTLQRHKEFEAREANKEGTIFQGLGEAEDLGPYAGMKQPLVFDKEHFLRNKNRPDYGSGIGSGMRRTEKEKQIESQLNRQTISLNFKQTPLDEVVDYMQKYTGINFDIDTRALAVEGIDQKMPITTSLNEIRLVSALGVVLDKANLRWVVDKEVVRISTQKGVMGKLVRRIVPVADLVVPVKDAVQSPTLDLQHMMQHTMSFGRPGNWGGTSATPTTPLMGLPTGSGSGVGTPSTFPGGGQLRNQMSGTGSTPSAVVTRTNASGTIEETLIRLITSSVHPETWEAMGGPGRVEYYPLGMALVINQSPEVIEEVTRLLESLRRLQDLEVALEVRYINLSESFYERIGLDFGMNLDTHNDRTLVNMANAGGGSALSNFRNITNAGGKLVGLQAPGVPTTDLSFPVQATSFGPAIPPFGGFPNAPGADGGLSMGLAFLSGIQLQMFLEAAQGDRRTNIMQAPRLTMFNGQTASLQIQEQAFFLTGVSVIAVNGQLVFQPQNSPFPVGINLTLQPVISSDRRFVRLSINQAIGGFGAGNLISNNTFSAPASVPLIPITTIITPAFEGGSVGQPVPFTQYLQQPTFSTISVQTTVMVPDGGTVVLGGLKALSEGRNEFGPPVLSKIPYLNRLFRNVGYGRSTSNLMMLVTPRIIINREEQERQTGVVEGVGEEFLQQ